ncbi:unnamed protein product [Hymenolepis diminuta]|uniref:Ig-like domain-containing protein n=1 Tax=Hymenolepis diminuta TaxID=6216 RepID=A0A0R3SGW3_HYMDI|nr:unnamed protein product [Hymenolepis diminuta]
MTYKLLKKSEEWRPNEVMFQTEPGAKGSGASEPMYYVPQKPRIVQQLKSETVISGQPVIFVCMVEGNPSPRVQWTVSGLPVSSSPQLGEVVTTTRGSVLRISNALPPLHGTPVVCTAENALGHAEATARLFVYQNEEGMHDNVLY